MQWTRVEDGLPAESEDCLICCKYSNGNRAWFEAAYNGNGTWSDLIMNHRTDTVTHWMRVELPSEDKP